MTDHRIGTQEEWQAERDALLEEEKELTRRSDELARKRRELPWVPVETDYSFQTEHGTKTLAELFDGRSQLLVYHFMFGPTYTAGCPVCSSIADSLAPQVAHLKARDTTLLLASRAPLEKLLGYRERMGWRHRLGLERRQRLQPRPRLPPHRGGAEAVPRRRDPPAVDQMAAASGTDVAGYVTEGPGLSAYALQDGTVYRTYVTTARGLEPAMAYYGLLDRTPRGRHEEGELEHWLRRHDEYETS